MAHPLITIGITCHNAADTIEAAVASAMAQTWPETEIVLVDDASTDATPQVLEGLKARYPTLRVFRMAENKGVAAARNEIIRQAQGAFIAFFDDDDVSAPDRLQTQYKTILSYEEEYAEGSPVICHTARWQVYPGGGRRYEPTMGMNEEGPAPYGPPVAGRILFGRPVRNGFGSTATCSQMARAETYRNLGGFDEAFRRGEDTDFNIRAALAGAHFPGLRAALVTQTMTRASDKKLEDERKNALQLLNKHRAVIEEMACHEFCRRWIEAKYDFLQGKKGRFAFAIAGLAAQAPLRTAQKLLWALPNIGFNMQQRRFHQ